MNTKDDLIPERPTCGQCAWFVRLRAHSTWCRRNVFGCISEAGSLGDVKEANPACPAFKDPKELWA